MKVYVCVGSSCHLKGSYDVAMKLRELVDQYNLKDEVDLNATFCLGNCSNGVSMKIDEELISDVSKDTIESIFLEKILKVVKS